MTAVAHRALTQFTYGELELEFEAGNIRQLLRVLGERYPDLKPHLADGVAIAIDGEIFQDAWLEPIPPESEVHVIPQIVGAECLPSVIAGLYLAALWSRSGTTLRCPPFYRRLVAAGKARKLALTADMRKLLVILNAMLRDRQPWRTPQPA